MNFSYLLVLILSSFLVAGKNTYKKEPTQCRNHVLKEKTKNQTVNLPPLQANELRIFLNKIKCDMCAKKLKKHFSNINDNGENIFSQIKVDRANNYISLKTKVNMNRIEKTLITDLRKLGFSPLRAQIYGSDHLVYFQNKKNKCVEFCRN